MVTALAMQKAAPVVEPMAAPHIEPPPPPPIPQPAPVVEPAAFSSPRVSFDQNAGVIITQYRDVSSGEVRAQFPAESVVENYKRTDNLETKGSEPQASAPLQPPPAAPEEPEPASPALGMGGLGGGMPAGPAPMGATGNGLAAPERPVGGAAVHHVRTVA